jgi:ribose transport system substrate-binding protein
MYRTKHPFVPAAAAAAAAAMLASSGVALASSGVAGATGRTSASRHAAKSGITIGFVPSLASDPFFISMEYGAQQEAKKLGVKLIWQGAMGVYSPSAQLPYVNAVLAENPSAFILVPTDSKALMPSVLKAKSMGIPVLTVDTTVVNTKILASHITGDNVGGGALAAELLDKALGGKGQVFVMADAPGVTTDALREQGFTTQLKKYPGIKYEGLQYTEDQPSTAESDFEHVLSRFPHLGGVFAVDDTNAEGVIAALKAEKKAGTVKVVTYDAEPTEVASLRAGQLVAVVAQRPAVEGALAVLYAYDEVEHHPAAVRHSVIVPDVLLQRSTLASDAKWFYCTKLTSCSITWQPTPANTGA